LRSETIYGSGGAKLRARRFLVTDLDNTLIDSRARFNLAVSEATGYPQAITHQMSNTKSLTKDQRNKFYDVFLSGKYMDLDVPVKGSVETLKKLRAMGFGIVYLTGRHHSQEESLKYETLKTLSHYGYPIPDNSSVMLYMKPSKMSPTNEYKRNVLERLVRNMSIAVGVDDEENDLQVMVDLIPLVIGVCLSVRVRLELSSLNIPLAKNWFEVESIMAKRKVI
jgi:predicted secreted acid phosphatase